MQGINRRRLRSFGRRTQHPERRALGDQSDGRMRTTLASQCGRRSDGRRHQRVGTSIAMVWDCSGGVLTVDPAASSRETAMTIVATESRLVAAHVAYTP